MGRVSETEISSCLFVCLFVCANVHFHLHRILDMKHLYYKMEFFTQFVNRLKWKSRSTTPLWRSCRSLVMVMIMTSLLRVLQNSNSKVIGKLSSAIRFTGNEGLRVLILTPVLLSFSPRLLARDSRVLSQFEILPGPWYY